MVCCHRTMGEGKGVANCREERVSLWSMRVVYGYSAEEELHLFWNFVAHTEKT